uniref:Uncharacterized protein n=1 Tax=viral metagenome TaxID=1070528 RepID=A0A6C0CB97_9ZZZZ
MNYQRLDANQVLPISNIGNAIAFIVINPIDFSCPNPGPENVICVTAKGMLFPID